MVEKRIDGLEKLTELFSLKSNTERKDLENIREKLIYERYIQKLNPYLKGISKEKRKQMEERKLSKITKKISHS